jgi:AraC-like DNA-binding protein
MIYDDFAGFSSDGNVITVYRYLKYHRRIFFLILAALLLLGTLPLVIFTGLTYRYFRSFVESQVVSAQLDRLHQTESYITAVLDEVEARSYEFVLNIRFMDVGAIGIESIGEAETALSARRVQELLANIRDTNRFVHSAYYFNSQRGFLITSDGSLTLPDHYDTDWIATGLPPSEASPIWLPTRVALDGAIRELPMRLKLYESLGVRSVPVISFIRPVSRFVASFGGYVVVNIGATALAEELAVVSREPDGEFLIVDDSGRIILSTDLESVGTDLGIVPDQFVDASREGTTLFERGNDSLIAYYKVGSDGWVYAFVRDASGLLTLSREVGRVAIVLALAVGVAAAAAAFFVSRRLYDPIDTLMADIDAQAEALPPGTNELARIRDVLQQSLSERAELRVFAGRSAQAIKENTLRRLIAGQVVDAATVLSGLRAVGGKMGQRWFGMALIVITRANGTSTESPTTAQMTQMTLIRYCEGLHSPEIELLGVTTEANRVALLVNTRDPAIARRSLTHVRDEALSALDVEVTIVAGRFYPLVVDASASYDDAVAVLNGHVLNDGEFVLFRDDVELRGNRVPAYPLEIEGRLIYHLKAGSRDEVIRELDRFLTHVFSYSEGDRSEVEATCMTLISSIVRVARLMMVRAGSEGENPYRNFLEQNLSVVHIKTWFTRFLDDVLDRGFGGSDRNSRYKLLIQQCIDESYRDDISLEQVADRTGISYSYIRKIFHTLFGMNFSYYLNTLRVEKAREYLRTTNDAIAEVARNVGYVNSQRFYRNFRKLTGCTPMEYRLAANSPARGDGDDS